MLGRATATWLSRFLEDGKLSQATIILILEPEKWGYHLIAMDGSNYPWYITLTEGADYARQASRGAAASVVCDVYGIDMDKTPITTQAIRNAFYASSAPPGDYLRLVRYDGLVIDGATSIESFVVPPPTQDAE